MNKYQGNKKLLVTSVIVAALGLLAMANQTTVNAAKVPVKKTVALKKGIRKTKQVTLRTGKSRAGVKAISPAVGQTANDLVRSGTVAIDGTNYNQYFTQTNDAVNGYDPNTNVQTMTSGSSKVAKIYSSEMVNLNSNFSFTGSINLGTYGEINGAKGIANGMDIGFVKKQGQDDNPKERFSYWHIATWYDHNDAMDAHAFFITTDNQGNATSEPRPDHKMIPLVSLNQAQDNPITFQYTGADRTMTVKLTINKGMPNEQTFTSSKQITFDTDHPFYYFTVSSTSGDLPTVQSIKITSLTDETVRQITVNPGDPNPVDPSIRLDTVREIKRKINYTGAPRPISSVTQSKTFSRTAAIDAATGVVISYGNWDKANDILEEVKSPEIAGYLPNLAKVPAEIITADSYVVSPQLVSYQAIPNLNSASGGTVVVMQPASNNNLTVPAKTEKVTVKHNAYLYDKQGQRIDDARVIAGSVVKAVGKKVISGQGYYELPGDMFIAAGNIDGTSMKLTHNSYLYNQFGKRRGKKVLKKNQKVRTYGNAVKIKGSKYYIIDNNRYVKAANFK